MKMNPLLASIALTLSAAVLTPAMVPAAEAPAPAPTPMQTIATIPTNGLEGLEVDADGTLYVTDATAHVIHRIQQNGAVSRFASLKVVPQVIVHSTHGWLVTAQEREPDFAAIAKSGRPLGTDTMGALGAMLLELDRNGRVIRRLRGPPGAFFNGMARLGQAVLIADSTAATIWRADARKNELTAWLRSPLLAGQGGHFPGANGLKVANGYVYVSNTTANALYRIAVNAAGSPDGKLELVATVKSPDDFAVAKDDSVYLPSEGVLMRISAGGVVTRLAEGCVGCDAALLAENGRALLMVTHGFGPDAGPGHVYRLGLAP